MNKNKSLQKVVKEEYMAIILFFVVGIFHWFVAGAIDRISLSLVILALILFIGILRKKSFFSVFYNYGFDSWGINNASRKKLFLSFTLLIALLVGVIDLISILKTI